MEKELHKLRETLHTSNQKVQELETRFEETNQNSEILKKTILDLQIQNAALQESKKELEANYEQLLSSKTISGYTDQLEKECNLLKITVEKLREENIAIIKERETYEMTHSQIRLDNETVMIEVGKLKSENQNLKNENKVLLEENKNWSVANLPQPTPVISTPPTNPPKPILQVGGAPTAITVPALKKPRVVQSIKQRKR
jgi:TolA-binding protein